MRIDNVIQLIASSSAPVEIRFSSGRITRAMIRAEVKEMTQAELARFIEQITQRFQHGTLTTENVEGKLMVKWEESVIVGEKR